MKGKKTTTEDFVNQAKKVHGNMYDYSKVVYVNSYTKVLIGCPKHGFTLQYPYNHLRSCGCLYCFHENEKQKKKTKQKLVFGVGINDYVLSITDSQGKVLYSYCVWSCMLSRCYGLRRKQNIAYSDCIVCNEWLRFSNFKVWFDANYKEGYHLDKDILIKGNKVYSPDTCCFVPQEINKLFTKHDRARGAYPLGVHKGKRCGYIASVMMNNNVTYIGSYRTPNEAFFAYKEKKEAYIKQVAQEYFYKGLIKERVYNALMKYEVEIND